MGNLPRPWSEKYLLKKNKSIRSSNINKKQTNNTYDTNSNEYQYYDKNKEKIDDIILSCVKEPYKEDMSRVIKEIIKEVE